MNMIWTVIAILTSLLALVVLSYIVEARRSAKTLVWSPRNSHRICEPR